MSLPQLAEVVHDAKWTPPWVQAKGGSNGMGAEGSLAADGVASAAHGAVMLTTCDLKVSNGLMLQSLCSCDD